MDGHGLRSANKTVAIITLAITGATAQAGELDKSIRCLADNLYHEARGEGMHGMVAVANVVMNRVHDHHFPANVCAVVYQPKQFSWTNKRSLRRMKVKHTEEMKLIAKLAITGLLKDITGDAQFYHASYVKPSWAYYMKRTRIIGKHRFYRLD